MITWISEGIGTVLPFIILLGVLIFVHELGHFLVARWCGVRVETFSLGFGKKILKYVKGDTTYAISIIPLGGYVKMFGEQNGDEIPESERNVSFTHKSVWKRIAIVAAGPLMNFFFAILIFFVVIMVGEPAKSPQVGDIGAASKAYEYGFRSGDTILKVENEIVKSWEDIQNLLNENKGKSVVVDVKREGSEDTAALSVQVEVQPTPSLLSISDTIGGVEGLTNLSQATSVGVRTGSPLQILGLKSGSLIYSVNGVVTKYWRVLQTELENASIDKPLEIQFYENADVNAQLQTLTYTAVSETQFNSDVLGLESSELYVHKVVKDSPAEKAGVKEFDRIYQINDVKIAKWEEVLTNIKSYDGQNPVKLTVIRNNVGGEEKLTFDLSPEMTTHMTNQGSEEKRFTIGIISTSNTTSTDLITISEKNPIIALKKGFVRTVDLSAMTVMSFIRLIQTKISHKNVGGIITIGQAARDTFKTGMIQFLQMMALISINLFILNLLPVPVLDGGHLLFYVIEILKGSPLSMSKLEVAQQIGLALLMGLMVLSVFNDITRVFGL